MSLAVGVGGSFAPFANVAQAAVIAFTKSYGRGSGPEAGTGPNWNGIADNGAVVGFGLNNAGVFTTFVRTADANITSPNINGSATAVAFEIDDSRIAVGYYGDSVTSRHGLRYNPDADRLFWAIPPSSSTTARRSLKLQA